MEGGKVRLECAACQEPIYLDVGEGDHRPVQLKGLWYCRECGEELAHGIVNTEHLHTARLFSSGRGCPLERNDDGNPSQENAVRDMEEFGNP
jgi:hypothetical protein